MNRQNVKALKREDNKPQAEVNAMKVKRN